MRRMSGDFMMQKYIFCISENIRYSPSFWTAMSLFARIQVTFNFQKILL